MILAPWENRIFVAPLCASCKVPVLRFHLNPTPERLIVEAQCHGKTDTAAIPLELAMQLMQLRRSFVMFKRRDGFNLVLGDVRT